MKINLAAIPVILLLAGAVLFGQQNPIQIDANGLTQTLTAGGVVTRGQIVKINSAGQVVPVLTTDTSGAIGVAATSQTSAGNGIAVSIQGTPLVQIDSGGCTAGNIVSFSTTTGGAGHCAATVSGQQVGIALSISSPGSNFWNVALSLGGGGGAAGTVVFNVKNSNNGVAGAVGDTKASHNCTTASSSKIITNTDNPWTAADVGKFMEIVSPGQGTDVFTPARKIASFQSAGQVTMDTVQDGGATPGSGQNCKWFTQDDTAAFQAAVTAAKTTLASKTNDPFLQTPTLAYPAEVYCPPGGYTVSSTIFYDGKSTGAAASLGVALIGSPGSCIIYPTATFSGVTDTLCTGLQTGLISTCQTFRSDIEDINVEGHAILIGAGGVASGQGWIMLNKCKTCTVKDVTVNELGLTNFPSAILYMFSSSGIFGNLYIQNGGGAGGGEAACRIEQSTSVLFENNLCSNHNQSLIIANGGGRGSGGGQLTLLNETTDECGGAGGACTVITGSVVNYVGGTSFGGTPEIMSVDGTSQVYLMDHNLQVFGSSAGSVPGILEVAGSLVEASGSTLASNGASPIVSGPSTATFVDVGGNTYLNCVSGTCNAITATNYATRGFSGGIIPKSTQTHTPNTCYAVTGNLLATAQNLCIVLLDQNYQLLNMTAQSGGTTPANSACATPPVITLSDGTRTATMTMTSGKAAWNSGVDAVTNINQVFASGATLTVSIGANTCATPPSNVSVNYNLQSAVNP